MTDRSNSELKTNFDQFGLQLVYFSNCILQDIAPESSGKEGLADVQIIHALLGSQGKKGPMRIAAVEELERPTLKVLQVCSPPHHQLLSPAWGW